LKLLHSKSGDMMRHIPKYALVHLGVEGSFRETVNSNSLQLYIWNISSHFIVIYYLRHAHFDYIYIVRYN